MEQDNGNLDSEWVQAFILAGARLIGRGTGQGKDRALQAAQTVTAMPLLNLRNKKVRKLLIHIASGVGLEVAEAHQIIHMIRYAAGVKETEVFYSLTLDTTLDDAVRVTALAHFK